MEASPLLKVLQPFNLQPETQAPSISFDIALGSLLRSHGFTGIDMRPNVLQRMGQDAIAKHAKPDQPLKLGGADLLFSTQCPRRSLYERLKKCFVLGRYYHDDNQMMIYVPNHLRRMRRGDDLNTKRLFLEKSLSNTAYHEYAHRINFCVLGDDVVSRQIKDHAESNQYKKDKVDTFVDNGLIVVASLATQKATSEIVHQPYASVFSALAVLFGALAVVKTHQWFKQNRQNLISRRSNPEENRVKSMLTKYRYASVLLDT